MVARSSVADRADAVGLGRKRQPRRSLVDVVSPAGSAVTVLPLSRLAADPRNLREVPGDLEGMAQTIREHGIFQALIVCTRAAYAAAHPDQLLPDDGSDHVALDGHRRMTAAAMAEQTAVPVTVHDEWAGASKTTLQLITGVHAQTLSPVDVADGIARLLEEHPDMKQRDVAPYLGVSQPTVSRNLAILAWPDLPRKLLREARISREDGAQLATLHDVPDGPERAYTLMTRVGDVVLSAGAAVEQVRAEHTIAINAEASRIALEAAGITVVDPRSRWGAAAEAHHLAHGDLPAGDRRIHRACLAAAIGHDGLVDWYCLDLAAHGRLDDVSESRTARARRAAAVQSLAMEWPGTTFAANELADGVLAAARPGAALRLALGWAKDAGFVEPEMLDLDQDVALARLRSRLAADSRVKMARLLTIAASDVSARRPGNWGPEQGVVYGLMQRAAEFYSKVSYSPTPWEAHRLGLLDEAEIRS